MAKYKKEDNWGEISSCKESDFKGNKASSRPVSFCKSVNCLDTLSVAGPTVLNNASVIPPAITIGGLTFVPTTIMTVTGPVMVLAIEGTVDVGG
jgi:hypothetical protein